MFYSFKINVVLLVIHVGQSLKFFLSSSGLVFMATESPKMLVYYIPVSSILCVFTSCNITNTITNKAENETCAGLYF